MKKIKTPGTLMVGNKLVAIEFSAVIITEEDLEQEKKEIEENRLKRYKEDKGK